MQRVADLLVESGLAEYRDNPGHRRAKLLVCMEVGYRAIRQISVVHHPWAKRIGGELGCEARALRSEGQYAVQLLCRQAFRLRLP